MSRLPPSARSASATALVAPVGVPRSPRTAAVTCASAAGLRLRYPTATFAPARASSTAVARPMPRPPPVTNARLPERSITAHPHCGFDTRPSNPQSEIRNPQSFAQLLLDDPADHVLDRKLQLLDMRGLIGRDDERVVDQAPHGAAALAEQRDHADALGARRLGRAQQVGALAAGRMQDEQVAGPQQRLYLPGKDHLEPQIVAARGEQ